MKKNKGITSTRLAATLEPQKAKVEKEEARIIQQVLDALKDFDREKARDVFQLVLEWNTLHKTITSLLSVLIDNGVPVYVVSAWFLEDTLAHVTPRKDEAAVYITGPVVGGVRVLSRICGFELAEQSITYARGDTKACLDALIEINEHGNALHAMAHSHPGSGKSATRQSPTDIRYLTSIQRAGANVIGLIFTRDGHVRFFTVEKPFKVIVLGEGVTQLEENVYKIEKNACKSLPHEKGKDEKASPIKRFFALGNR